MTPEAQNKSRDAIIYMLRRIQREPRLAWYMISTEAHALLLDAIAEIEGLTPVEAEDKYYPTESEDPFEAGREKAISDAAESGDSDHLLAAAIVDEPDPVVIDVRTTATLEEIFFSLNDALSEDCAGRAEFLPNKFPGYNRITIIPR
jgi:hypothetical protein